MEWCLISIRTHGPHGGDDIIQVEVADFTPLNLFTTVMLETLWIVRTGCPGQSKAILNEIL